MTKKQLQVALNSLAKANRIAYEQRDKISNHCMAVYGVDPADIDNEAFTDLCDGGCGAAKGMTVAEFEKSMRDCMDREKYRGPTQSEAAA